MNIVNCITFGNLCMGITAIVCALQGRFSVAAYCILVGMFLDVLDGQVARMTNTCSESGKYLDSTADFVTFGVAPAILLSVSSGSGLHWLVIVVLGLYALAGGFRLVRFTFTQSSGAGKGFKGFPITTAAGCLISFALIFYNKGSQVPVLPLLVLVSVLSLLMISTIPYIHVSKLFHRTPPRLRVVFFALNIIFMLMNRYFTFVFFGFAVYLLQGVYKSMFLSTQLAPEEVSS